MIEVFVALLAALWVRDITPVVLRLVVQALIDRDRERTLKVHYAWEGRHSRAWRISGRLGLRA